jgi:hypothetical protein
LKTCRTFGPGWDEIGLYLFAREVLFVVVCWVDYMEVPDTVAGFVRGRHLLNYAEEVCSFGAVLEVANDMAVK